MDERAEKRASPRSSEPRVLTESLVVFRDGPRESTRSATLQPPALRHREDLGCESIVSKLECLRHHIQYHNKSAIPRLELCIMYVI